MVSDSSSESKTVTREVPPGHRAHVRAAKVPNPSACGCGRQVAYDVQSKAFFCIGCGQTQECVCRRDILTSTVRPVNVV